MPAAAAARPLRVPLDELALAPHDALRALVGAGEPWPFALTGDWAGGGAIVGARPLRVAEPDAEDPFALLDEQPPIAGAADHGRVAGFRGTTGNGATGGRRGAAGDSDGGAIVGGGWFGWLGYGLGARVERLAPPPPRPVPLPPFQLAYYDHVLRRDARGRWWFEALATDARAAALEERCVQLRALLAEAAATRGREPLPAAGSVGIAAAAADGHAPLAAAGPVLIAGEATGGYAPPGTPGPSFRIAGAGAAGHLHAVAECRERIAAGEIFQANVCLRLEAEWEGDVADLFARASARLAPARGAAFPAPWGGIASLSPELFLHRRGRAVQSAPIKGTIPRDAGADAADPARTALLRSEKDGAEHTMIVDLMRNDLGRVCTYGSIAAEPEPLAEPHPGVWHLVTRVRGRLREDADDGELLRAAFPPGSVTGAPKVQALHTIGELEGSAREAYTGAIGFASPLAGLELSVAIRTFEARDGHLWLGAGGGVVADSDPTRELEECLVKARPLIAAIGGSIEEEIDHARKADGPPARAVAGPPARAVARGVGSPAKACCAEGAQRRSRTAPHPVAPAALASGRRPDPRVGVFETLLVRHGEAPQAPAHLARLAASAAALYDAELPDDLAERVADAAANTPTGNGALRIHARAGAPGTVTIAIASGEERERALPVRLAPFVLPGGLGAHKWHDRRLLDALAAPGATPLLLDGDGAVLEAAWGNLFALEGDSLTTPPADGRLLPGVTRAALLEAAAGLGLVVSERPLTLQRLAGADAILVTSALAGAVPATVEGHRADPGARALVRDLTRQTRSPALPANA